LGKGPPDPRFGGLFLRLYKALNEGISCRRESGGIVLHKYFGAAMCAFALVLSGPLRAEPAASNSASAAPGPTRAVAERIPIDVLAEPAYLRGVTLSPDGYSIAARVTVGNEERIAVWDLHAAPGTAPRLLAQDGFDVRWLRWAGAGRLLLGIGMTRRLDGREFPISRIISLDVRAWHGTPLDTGHGMLGDDVIFVDPQGTYILVSAQPTADQYPAVSRIDLATGASTRIQNPRTGIWDWFADRRGVVRAGVDYGDDRIKFYYRSAPDEELRRIDTRRYPQDGSAIDMIRFVTDSDHGVVVTNAVTGRFAVYDYNFATDTRGEAIFEHPTADVTSTIMGEDGQIDGVAYEDDRRRVHWINPALQRVQATIDRALSGKDNLILDQSGDGNRILVFSSAADDPGTYYVYDRARSEMQTFASPFERLAEHHFALVRPVTFHSRGGADIPGYLTLPPGREAHGLPLVLMPHGGPFARDSWEFDPWVQFLASRGYAVLQVNFRGSTGYGRSYAESGYGQWGTGMIDDIEDGVDWLAGQGTIDPRRVCIMGGSYGGYAALWAPIRNADRYRCAISFAPVTDVRGILRYDNRFFIARRYTREWTRKVQGEERTDLAAISPLQQAARLTVPVLLAHGERDRTVPVGQSRDLIRALDRAGTNRNVETVFYPEEAHGFSRPQDSADFLRRVEAFLARYNPAEASPAAPPERTAQAAR
jgi:dipeptidyl aminopeptidase/acylaminoacyl peptidase